MLAIQRTIPPFVVHLVVVKHGDGIPKSLGDVFRQQDFGKMIFSAKLGELCFAEKFFQLTFLGLHRSDGLLLDLHGDVFQFRGGFDDSTK